VTSFRYFELPEPGTSEDTYFRLDTSAPPGKQVRVMRDGLWQRWRLSAPGIAPALTAEQFLQEFGPHAQEVSATDVPCPMCAVVADEVTREVVFEWPETLAIKPLPSGLVEGHTLVIPKVHVVDAAEAPLITGMVTFRAAELGVALFGPNFQLHVNNGPEADQTVLHLHVHAWPRRRGDGLVMPWTAQRAKLTL
jgi:histidine triad (HIT) family protein